MMVIVFCDGFGDADDYYDYDYDYADDDDDVSMVLY
jgi:hypothetical protein